MVLYISGMYERLEQKKLLVECRGIVKGLGKENCCLQPMELPNFAFNTNKSKLVIIYNIGHTP